MRHRGIATTRRYFAEILLPQIKAYVAYYHQHFQVDPATGTLRIFPAQALETWQCESVPPTPGDCVTNPMPEVRAFSDFSN